MNGKNLRLTTPAFTGIGRAGPPHWSVAIYERQLFPKALGYPLPVPTGLKIGDVCFVASNGKIQRCFNITTSTELPHYFSVLHPPLGALDFCKYQDFPGGSYIASRTLSPVRADTSLTFRCPAKSEASILVFPQGAVSTELSDTNKFKDYILQNAANWKRYSEDLEKDVGESVGLRLITATVTAPFWANAVVCTGETGSVLKFAEMKTADGRSAYFWDTRGFADAAVSASDAWNPNSRNDSAVIRGFSISPRKDVTMDGPPANGEEAPPESNRPEHPGDLINKKLLSMKSDVNLVISHDRDWCAVYNESDKAVLPENELLERVLANHEIQQDKDMAFLQWKPRRHKRPSSGALNKMIEELRASLEKVPKDDGPARVKIMHEITSKALQYLRIAASRNIQHAEMLMGVALASAQEEVAILTQRDEITADALHLLGRTLWTAFELAGDPKVLDQAITTYRKALDVESNHVNTMSDLAIAFWARYTKYKSQEDLAELVEFYKALLFSRPVNHKDEVKWLNSLGMGLWEKYRQTHDATDMDHAVAYLRRASRSYPVPCDPFTLSNLGNALLARSRHRRELTDLNEALQHYRRALTAVNALHPGRSAFLSNLADALVDRYERTQDTSDLGEAIRAYERVLELPPPHHRDKATCVLFYANALHDRFRKSYDAEDLKATIKRYREAKQRASPAHPHYGKIVEKLALAEKELARMTALLSPPPPGQSAPYPRPISQRDFIQQHPGPAASNGAASTNGAAAQKFRIVRPPAKKPYSRRAKSSESEATTSPPGSPVPPPMSPRHGLPPRARRHHTLGHVS